jgi:hypothetical protein
LEHRNGAEPIVALHVDGRPECGHDVGDGLLDEERETHGELPRGRRCGVRHDDLAVPDAGRLGGRKPEVVHGPLDVDAVGRHGRGRNERRQHADGHADVDVPSPRGARSTTTERGCTV